MSSELALLSDTDEARWGARLVVAAQIAERVAGTEFVPTAMRGKPDVVVAAIMYGAEIGVGPMQALAGIHVVEGRPAPSAELMRAMILRAGHSITVHELTGTKARISGLRAGAPESERTFLDWTLDMARAAGLLHRQNWQRYPRAMLLARATGDLARMMFPDAVKGLGYVAEDGDPDELAALAPGDTEAEPVAPSRKRVQRRTRPRSPAPVESPPAPSERATKGTGETANPLPVTPRPPAPTKVDPTDRPIPELEGYRPSVNDDPPPPSATPIRSYVDRRLPPDPAEPGDPEPGPPEVAPATIGAAQLAALQTKLGNVMGSTATRPERHALVGAILGHPIESTKTLSRPDGFKVLSFLASIESGEATWEVDETGETVVFDLRVPDNFDDPPPVP